MRRPLTVVTFCYFWIFTIAKKQASRIIRENVVQNSNEINSPARTIQNHKAIKTIGFVLGVFIVSWMPSLVLSVVHYVTSSDKCFSNKLVYIVWPWIEAVGLTSSAINPWIYFFRSREFREAFRGCCHFFSLNVTPQLCLRTRPESEKVKSERQQSSEGLWRHKSNWSHYRRVGIYALPKHYNGMILKRLRTLNVILYHIILSFLV